MGFVSEALLSVVRELRYARVVATLRYSGIAAILVTIPKMMIAVNDKVDTFDKSVGDDMVKYSWR
jgi:hypothetical protein